MPRIGTDGREAAATPTPSQYAEIAPSWLKDEAAAPILQQAAREIGRFSPDRGAYGSPAQRRNKIIATGNAAARLRKHLAETDPTTRMALFGKSAADEGIDTLSETERMTSAAAELWWNLGDAT